jgi:hypothetical protein
MSHGPLFSLVLLLSSLQLSSALFWNNAGSQVVEGTDGAMIFAYWEAIWFAKPDPVGSNVPSPSFSDVPSRSDVPSPAVLVSDVPTSDLSLDEWVRQSVLYQYTLSAIPVDNILPDPSEIVTTVLVELYGNDDCTVKVDNELCNRCVLCSETDFATYTADCTNIPFGREVTCEPAQFQPGQDVNLFFPLTADAPAVVRVASPSAAPSTGPSSAPSSAPSAVPSIAPSAGPSSGPSFGPTSAPSVNPSIAPSVAPSIAPSAQPSNATPTAPLSPVISEAPSSVPSAQPTSVPSASPSQSPSTSPTYEPTPRPTASTASSCGKLTGCFLQNISTGAQIALSRKTVTAYTVPKNGKFTILCTTSGPIKYVEFLSAEGKMYKEWSAPWYMGGNFGTRVFPVSYLTATCGRKEVTVTGKTWTAACFKEKFTLQAKC